MAACSVVAASSQRMGPPLSLGNRSWSPEAGGGLKAEESCSGFGTTSERNLEWLERTPKIAHQSARSAKLVDIRVVWSAWIELARYAA